MNTLLGLLLACMLAMKISYCHLFGLRVVLATLPEATTGDKELLDLFPGHSQIYLSSLGES